MIVKLSISLLLIVVLSAASLVSANRGLSDLSFVSVKKSLDRWNEYKRYEDSADYENTLAQVKRAIKIAPGNPDQIAAHGRILAWYEYGRYIWQPSDDTAFPRALNEFRAAIRTRPVSAANWARVMTMKADLGQFDADYSQAMQHALKLGGREPLVSARVAKIGLMRWEHLNDQEKDIVMESIRLELQGRRRGHTWLTMVKYKRYTPVCEKLAIKPVNVPWIDRSCDKILKKQKKTRVSVRK